MGRCPSLGLLIIADGIYDRIRTKSDGVDLSDGSVDCALVPHDRSNYPTTQASYFQSNFVGKHAVTSTPLGALGK